MGGSKEALFRYIAARRERWLALALLVVLALAMYIVAAWYQWWQGDSFGGRMLLNAMWVWRRCSIGYGGDRHGAVRRLRLEYC